jgi:hypothetical protein
MGFYRDLAPQEKPQKAAQRTKIFEKRVFDNRNNDFWMCV